MILFHGSNKIIQHPLYGYGKPYNDYGLGFYCTESLEMAKEWSVSRNRDGYANQYELDLQELKILNLSTPEYCILHWLALLLKFRTFEISSPLAIEAKEYLLDHFYIDVNDYDLIIGYRADDSYFSFAQDFIHGAISYRQLNNALYLGKLGQQVVLKSKKAFDQIRYIDYTIASSDEWYPRKSLRDLTARKEYFNVERNKRQKGDIYITHILDERMMPDDSRLR